MLNKENINPEQEEKIEKNFKDEYYEKILNIKEGQILKGKIVDIQDEIVFVDIGGKSEGIVKSVEFKNPISKGDEIEVVVENVEDENGNVILSKRKADYFIARKKIKEAFESESFLEGSIVKEIKGGYQVQIYGLRVFLPFSQINQNKITRGSSVFKFKIIRCDLDKSNIVVSNREYEEIYKKEQMDHFFVQYKVGDVLSGKIVKTYSYGAIVELLNSVNAFLHLKDLSWNFVRDFKDLSLKEGDMVKVKILDINKSERKIQVGRKQITKDPFLIFQKKYKIGDEIKGKVSKLVKNGAFVALDKFVIGFIPTEEISWNSRVSSPSRFLKEGYFTKVKIVDIDSLKRKIILSLRQIIDDPWLSIKKKYPEGIKVKGRVKVVLKQNAFLTINNDIEARLNARSISWDKTYNDLKEEKVLYKNQNLDLVVVGYDYDKRLLLVSMKHMQEDPFKGFVEKYPKGSSVEVQIKGVFDDYIVVSFVDEGFNNLSSYVFSQDLDLNSGRKIDKEKYKVGDVLNIGVKYVDFIKKRIVLSSKVYQNKVEREEMKKYMNHKDTGNKVTLKDILDFKGIKM